MRSIKLIGLILCMLMMPWVSWAQSAILVVRSDDSAPYKEAQNTLLQSLGTTDYKVQAISLSDYKAGTLTPYILNAVEKDALRAVVAIGSQAAVSLHATVPESVPLLYTMVAGPESLGLTQGRYIIGITTDIPIAAQTEWIRYVLPSVKNIGVLLSKKSSLGGKIVQQLRQSLKPGQQLIIVTVEDHDSSTQAINALLAEGVDIVWSYPDPLVFDSTLVKSLLLAGLRKQVPVFGFSTSFVKAGALIGVGIDPKSQGAAAARLLDEMLEGNALVKERYQRHYVMPPEFIKALNISVLQQLRVSISRDAISQADFTVGRQP